MSMKLSEYPRRDPYLDVLPLSTASKSDVGWIGLVGLSDFEVIERNVDIEIPAAYKNIESRGGKCVFTAQTTVRSIGDEVGPYDSLGWSQLIEAAETSMAQPLKDGPVGPFTVQCDSELILGVIDFGCAYLHPEFRKDINSKITRIASIWDQGGKKIPDGWSMPCNGFNYGRVLLAEQISKRISEFSNSSLTEFEFYEKMDDGYLISDDTHMSYGTTHGTHVLSVAAGLTDPRVEFQKSSEDWAASQLSAKNVAPALVFVHLPLEAYKSSDRGALGKFIIDGVKYILAHRKNEDQKVVINISYGPYAGPHNGSSMLERCLDQLIIDNKNLQIVLGSGNGRLTRTAARVELKSEIHEGHVDFCIPAGDRTATYIELWTADVKVNVKVVAKVEGLPRPQIIKSERQVGDRFLTLVAFPPPVVIQGDQLYQLKFTRENADVECDVCAWIEKDSGPQGEDFQAYFTGPETALDVANLDTRSSFATGHKTTIVGAAAAVGNSSPASGVWDVDAAHLDEIALSYSGRSPPAASPRIFAVAEIDPSRPGLWGATVLHGTYSRMGGTSVAAPLYCRYLVEQHLREMGVGIGRIATAA